MKNNGPKDEVSAKNQIYAKFKIQYIGSENPDKKVLILGNSITYHSAKPEIGWHGDWGMAASCADKDYVHALFNKVNKICANIQFCVAHVSDLEIDFCNKERMDGYKIVKEYSPDIVVMRFGENIKPSDYDLDELEKNYAYFIKNYLAGKNTKFIFTTRFMKEKCVDDLIRAYCVKYGGVLVELGDLGDNPSMKAIGKFEHAGIQDHPGDEGMENIAERIFEQLNKML